MGCTSDNSCRGKGGHESDVYCVRFVHIQGIIILPGVMVHSSDLSICPVVMQWEYGKINFKDLLTKFMYSFS